MATHVDTVAKGALEQFGCTQRSYTVGRSSMMVMWVVRKNSSLFRASHGEQFRLAYCLHTNRSHEKSVAIV